MDDPLIRIREIFAELTRYPLEVLDPDADLEDDLGIDSVKRTEIFVEFRDQFGLPETFEVQPGELRTIRSIAGVIQRHREGGGADGGALQSPPLRPHASSDAIQLPAPLGAAPASARPREAPAASHRAAPATSNTDVTRSVIDAIAGVTRYPRDILVPEADLEDDLGIDALTLQQIFLALGQRPTTTGASSAPFGVRTVGDVVSQVREQRSSRAPVVQTAVADAIDVPRSRAADDFLRGGNARPFEGKVAFITGSGHGIGRVMALQLADLGARVIVNSFHSRERGEQTTADIRQMGGDAVHLWGSVAKTEHLQRMFDEIEQRYERLDFFVSNASNGVFARLEDITAEHWDRAFRTNVVAFHQGSILAARLMKPVGGKIVALSSPGAQRYIEYFGCLGPIKAAVESLVRYLSVELAPFNINVNAVSMGPIYGELLHKYPDKERLIPYWESLSMDRRLGDESDISNVVMHLLSPVANRITGTVTLVDIGGSQRI
jgi:enoyl-[acyl-carrier protein] reductase III